MVFAVVGFVWILFGFIVFSLVGWLFFFNLKRFVASSTLILDHVQSNLFTNIPP